MAKEKVTDYNGDVSLTAYMQLPLEQYFVLDPNQIKFIEANRFLLTVPRQTFFSLWLEPEVEISVVNLGQKIVLQAERCRIKGSDLVENMQLDSRFALRFVTELTWQSDGQVGYIDAKLNSSVWCEVIPPFNLMPREILVSSCNVVMNALVGSLLPMFCSRLAKDYDKWATNAQYRMTRAQRSMPLTQDKDGAMPHGSPNATNRNTPIETGTARDE